MNDEHLVEAFEACTLPPGDLTHERHLRLAWYYLSVEPLGRATERFKSALKRYAHYVGKPRLYHETITWAYMVLLNQCRESMAESAREFAELKRRFPGILDHRNGLLRRYYTQELLDSPSAREVFLLPGADAGTSIGD